MCVSRTFLSIGVAGRRIVVGGKGKTKHDFILELCSSASFMSIAALLGEGALSGRGEKTHRKCDQQRVTDGVTDAARHQ